jgi:hypothetical protein
MHLKIVAVALLAASVVIWVGIAARISARPPASSLTVPAQRATMPIEIQTSMVAMAGNHLFDEASNR